MSANVTIQLDPMKLIHNNPHTTRYFLGEEIVKMSCWKRNDLFQDQGLWFIPGQTIVSSKHHSNLWGQSRILQQHREKECNFEEVFFCPSIQQWRKRDKFFCSFLPPVVFQPGAKEHAFESSLRGTENWGGVVLVYFSRVCVNILFSSEIRNLKSSKYLILQLLQPFATGQAAWNWCQLQLKYLEDCRLPVFHYTKLSSVVYNSVVKPFRHSMCEPGR